MENLVGAEIKLVLDFPIKVKILQVIEIALEHHQVANSFNTQGLPQSEGISSTSNLTNYQRLAEFYLGVRKQKNELHQLCERIFFKANFYDLLSQFNAALTSQNSNDILTILQVSPTFFFSKFR